MEKKKSRSGDRGDERFATWKGKEKSLPIYSLICLNADAEATALAIMAMAIPRLFFLLFPLVVAVASPASQNPFTEKAALIRYWNRKVHNNLPHPAFLVSKLTPLSMVDAAAFSTIAAGDPSKLSSRLTSFCSAAGLLCQADLAPSLATNPRDSDFAGYQNSNFTNYGAGVNRGPSSFKNYSDDLNVPVDTFRRYGRDSVFHNSSFSSYDRDGNVVTANFTSYGTGSVGGNDGFSTYEQNSNVPNLRFTNYAADANGHDAGFSQYSVSANAGDQSFSGYGKGGNGETSDFRSYANDTNVIGSGFANYGEGGNGNADTFASYGDNGNVPENNFRSYSSGTTGGHDKFTSYRDQSNVGDDSFSSYAKGGNLGNADFTNYGKSFNPGSDTFKGYGQGSFNDEITFKAYFADNTTFKSYAKTGIEFKEYHNASSDTAAVARKADNRRPATSATNQPGINRWVEPGKFFREGSLKKGALMPMPDIRDRTAPRSFLPRSIAGKIPFSSSAISKIFRLLPGTAMSTAVESTVAECERPPSSGETKRCVTSAEDMIDFAVSVLGNDIAVRSTANTKGSKGNILIGEVSGLNGGKVTRSVSCHQSLMPFLAYYCHSVPRVRVYQAEILAVDSKEKINDGVAICHLDTSDWSPTHGAFLALGPGPGKIEVCHWIFEGDMTWTVADHL
ncbi:BURP domain-containing protein 12 [Apostasia shenzhenica]|uniref:BURP domain-containing protein 12 n=1 Tax=Apostasia shenzhenica TaxID=1088818 RepID=A0A2I0BFK9_9ASPA|nr:BURP domain-containing protein 12 [Apostasia shenzhenica]